MARNPSQATGALLILMPVFGAILFAAGIYLVSVDKAAVGAAMFAIGASQFAIFAALKAAAKQRAAQQDEQR